MATDLHRCTGPCCQTLSSGIWWFLYHAWAMVIHARLSEFLPAPVYYSHFLCGFKPTSLASTWKLKPHFPLVSGPSNLGGIFPLPRLYLWLVAPGTSLSGSPPTLIVLLLALSLLSPVGASLLQPSLHVYTLIFFIYFRCLFQSGSGETPLFSNIWKFDFLEPVARRVLSFVQTSMGTISPEQPRGLNGGKGRQRYKWTTGIKKIYGSYLRLSQK